MPIESFRLRLRHARKEMRKLTQPQLATAAGIKQPSLSELETGETKEVSGPVLISLARALRVRPEWLMTGDEPIEPDPASSLTGDERQLLESYRGATGRWRVTIRYMASLRTDAAQEEAADTLNYVLAKIVAPAVPYSKLGDRWTRPDRPPPSKKTS